MTRRAGDAAAILAQTARRAGVSDERVLRAMAEVDRARFVNRDEAAAVHRDAPIRIGRGQTTSQPSLIARMLELMQLTADDAVLEVGTGSGYQTAILSRLAGQVLSIDRHATLVDAARERLTDRSNVTLVVGDGTKGWPAAAPYDAITVGAVGPEVPTALGDQLAEGGRLVMPVGTPDQARLEVHRRQGGRLARIERLMRVRFVPLVQDEGGDD